MAGRALSVTFVFTAALADLRGLHGVAYYLLLAAIPATAIAALESFGQLVECATRSGEEGLRRLDALLSGLILTLAVVSTAARSQAPVAGATPALARSALLGCLAVIGLHVTLVVGRLARERLGLVPARHARARDG